MEINWEKKYNEALERARALREEAIEKEYVNDYVKDYEAIFPELAESEDERIRKQLVDIVAFIPEANFKSASREDCRAYLEKQKEQTPGWSEENEKILVAISKALGCDTAEKILVNEGVTLMMAAGFLESLRPQLKPEWSEEDNIMALTIMRDIEQVSFISKEGKNERIGWLNKLPDNIKPQPRWKPSEEQMGVFGRIVNDLKIKMVGVTIKEHRTLESLYNDIKKRM